MTGSKWFARTTDRWASRRECFRPTAAEEQASSSGQKTQTASDCQHAIGAPPPGCFMRPVAGSGVWINTGRTQAAASLRLEAGIRNPMAADVLKAVRDGVDTLQYAWGDAVHQGSNLFAWPPLLVSTSPECVGRRQGVRACLPNEMRSGWHDSACKCDDMLGVINCAARARPSPPARVPPQPSLNPRTRRMWINGTRRPAWSHSQASPTRRQRVLNNARPFLLLRPMPAQPEGNTGCTAHAAAGRVGSLHGLLRLLATLGCGGRLMCRMGRIRSFSRPLANAIGGQARC